MPTAFPEPWGPGRTLGGDASVLRWDRVVQSAAASSIIFPEHLFLKRVYSVDHLTQNPCGGG